MENRKQDQIDKFIEEFNSLGLKPSDFTKFKSDISENRLSEFNLIYSLQTMTTYGKSFTTYQLNPEVYIQVKKAINYKPKSGWICENLKRYE